MAVDFLCKYVVIAFVSGVPVPDQIGYLDGQGVHYRPFLAENEWLLTYPSPEAGATVVAKLDAEKAKDGLTSGFDYGECLQVDRHHRNRRTKPNRP